MIATLRILFVLVFFQYLLLIKICILHHGLKTKKDEETDVEWLEVRIIMPGESPTKENYVEMWNGKLILVAV